jgi:hypothetical protein
MTPLALYRTAVLNALRDRWHALRAPDAQHAQHAQPERGSSTAEYVVLTVVFVLLAVAVGTIITLKCTGAANGISIP